MNIQHQDNAQHGGFFIFDDQQQRLAELTYFYESPQRINANHTYVADSLRGQGVADKLYQALIAFIDERHLSLHPTCSYIARKWERENRQSGEQK